MRNALGTLLRVGQLLERDLVDDWSRAGEVGADDDPLDVADDQQRRVLEVLAVVEQLAVGGVQVGATSLVLPSKEPPTPHIGEAGGAVELGDALLEAVPIVRGVGLGGREDTEHRAEVIEVRLRDLALATSVRPPLRDELVSGHRGMGR